MWRRNENKLRKRLLIESGTLIIELVSQDTRHQLYQTCHFAVTSALPLRRQNIHFRNSKATSLIKYLNFKRTGQEEKKIRILHTKKISGEISAAFTRMFSIVTTILKITQFQKQTTPFFAWRRRALFRVFLWRWKKFLWMLLTSLMYGHCQNFVRYYKFHVAQPPYWKTARSRITSTACGYNYYYRYSALGPVWAETRAQSVDWYSSGTLHPGQVLRGSLPLLSPAFSRSHFRHQVPQRRERSPAAEGGTVGENVVR